MARNKPSFKTNASLTDLLNEAQAAAILAMNGAPAIPSELATLAAHVRGVILTQAALGRWSHLRVHNPDDLVDLKVTASLGNRLVGEPPIKIEYDFSKTARPDIVVNSVWAS